MNLTTLAQGMHFGVNKVFHSGLVLLFSIEHIIVPFNQIVQIVMPRRRCQISFQILDKLLRNPSLSPKRFGSNESYHDYRYVPHKDHA